MSTDPADPFMTGWKQVRVHSRDSMVRMRGARSPGQWRRAAFALIIGAAVAGALLWKFNPL